MGLPKLRSTFGEFLVPTWLHFASQNPPKTLPKATPRGTKILIDFCIAFLSFLAPFWPPTWGQLGAQDGFKIEKMGSKNSRVAPKERFEMRPCLSTPSWAILASIFGVLGSIFEGFGWNYRPSWSAFGCFCWGVRLSWPGLWPSCQEQPRARPAKDREREAQPERQQTTSDRRAARPTERVGGGTPSHRGFV